jgi:hypothetical protein
MVDNGSFLNGFTAFGTSITQVKGQVCPGKGAIMPQA